MTKPGQVYRVDLGMGGKESTLTLTTSCEPGQLPRRHLGVIGQVVPDPGRFAVPSLGRQALQLVGMAMKDTSPSASEPLDLTRRPTSAREAVPLRSLKLAPFGFDIQSLWEGCSTNQSDPGWSTPSRIDGCHWLG
jgi:hypothetical protein